MFDADNMSPPSAELAKAPRRTRNSIPRLRVDSCIIARPRLYLMLALLPRRFWDCWDSSIAMRKERVRWPWRTRVSSWHDRAALSQESDAWATRAESSRTRFSTGTVSLEAVVRNEQDEAALARRQGLAAAVGQRLPHAGVSNPPGSWCSGATTVERSHAASCWGDTDRADRSVIFNW